MNVRQFRPTLEALSSRIAPSRAGYSGPQASPPPTDPSGPALVSYTPTTVAEQVPPVDPLA